MRPGAVVLCGGESRRMGRAKAWLPFGVEALLQRVVRLASRAASPIVVVGAPGQDLPDLPGSVVIVRDEAAGRGPLQGLVTGFAAMPEPVELVYATATDVPFLEPRWISRLVERIGDFDLVIPKIGGRLQPLAALYRRPTLLPVMEGLLSASQLRLRCLADTARALVLAEDDLRDIDPAFGTVRNLNDTAEYEQALKDAGLSPDPPTSNQVRDGLA